LSSGIRIAFQHGEKEMRSPRKKEVLKTDHIN